MDHRREAMEMIEDLGGLTPFHIAAMTETIQPVECGTCGWRSKRKTGNVVICPKCGEIAGFDVRATSSPPQ